MQQDYNSPVHSPDFSVCERVLTSRWMISIMALLSEPKRFGDIQQLLSGISRGVLASQLQELCQMQLTKQYKHTCFPPCVEYELTEKGESLLGILNRISVVLD